MLTGAFTAVLSDLDCQCPGQAWNVSNPDHLLAEPQVGRAFDSQGGNPFLPN